MLLLYSQDELRHNYNHFLDKLADHHIYSISYLGI